MTNENTTDFPVKCQVCKQEIEGGKIFWKHPDIGFVCEDCPEFNDGPFRRVSENEE